MSVLMKRIVFTCKKRINETSKNKQRYTSEAINIYYTSHTLQNTSEEIQQIFVS